MSAIEAGDSVKQAIGQVHDDNAAGVDWAVISYVSKTELVVVATGSGGLTQVSDHLGEQAAYAIIRYTLKLDDKATTVRFAFVEWVPESVPPMTKSFISTQKGAVHALFSPFHVNLSASDSSDLDESVITHKMSLAAGVLHNVVEHKAAEHKAQEKHRDPTDFTHTATKICIVSEEEVRGVMKQLRDGSDASTTWLLMALNSQLELELVGTGGGSAEDMGQHFREGTTNYALIRVTDVIDFKSVTTKFAYIVYMPDDVPPMRKAKISTIAGSIKECFSPFHVELFISSKEELTQALVEDKIQSASGSKSHVKQ